jgi:hypothetical protein
MGEDVEKAKAEWPKEILEHLQGAGPWWSTVLGVLLLACGVFLRSPPLEGSGIAILAVGFLLAVSRRPSQLTRTDAFVNVRSLFVGREHERDKLVDAIRRSPLLWVSGESGSGKSSLVRMGVTPCLSDSKEFLPLYIDNWGSDWEAGPVAALTWALRESAQALGAKLQLEGRPTASDLSGFLEQAASVLDRTPVVILDQFDDYIVENIERFRPSGGGLIIGSEELKQQNSFWRGIAQLVEAGTVRCIFIVRQEQGWGQAAVSFANVREFFVPRLQRRFLDQILDQATAGAIVNPERGWNDLRERLKKDLYASGGILPIQMRVVLQQLPTLKNLTVKAYERSGGAIGLAAEYAAECVDRVAAATRTPPPAVRRVLRALVNPADKSKTRDVSAGVLETELAGTLDALGISHVLDQLKAEEMVRDRADETGVRRWRFDHDYLASAVDELDRRETASQRVLQEHMEVARASGFWRKRDALIQPSALWRIMWDRLRGRLTVGNAWPVLAASSAVWFLIAAVSAVGAYSIATQELDTNVDNYVAWLDRAGNTVDSREAKRWADLAQEPLLLRQRVARTLLMEARTASQLMYANRARMAAAALGGLSPSAPQQFRVPLDCSSGKLTPACVFLASQFGQEAEAVGRSMLALNSFTYQRIYSPDQKKTLREIARFISVEKLLDICPDAAPATDKDHSLFDRFFYRTPCEYLRDLANRKVSETRAMTPAKTDKEKAEGLLRSILDVPFGTVSSVPLEGLGFPEGPASAYAYDPVDISAYIGDASLNAEYVPLLLAEIRRKQSRNAAYALSVLARYIPTQQAVVLGREMLTLTKTSGVCVYRDGFVRADDIPTALSALENPPCAAEEGEEIQKAIVEATTHRPAGEVDRWTFAREWVQPNAAKYGYDPDRYNRFYASYVRPRLRKLIPWPHRPRP